MDLMTTYAATLLMGAHDEKAEKPKPAEGEPVTAYWLRVIQFQVWADSHEHCTSIGCPNPYATKED